MIETPDSENIAIVFSQGMGEEGKCESNKNEEDKHTIGIKRKQPWRTPRSVRSIATNQATTKKFRVFGKFEYFNAR